MKLSRKLLVAALSRSVQGVKDLASGEDEELFAAPPPNPPTSPEPNVILSVLGWANNN